MNKMQAIKGVIYKLNTMSIHHTSHSHPYCYTLTFHKDDGECCGEVVINKYINDTSGWISYSVGDFSKMWKLTGVELLLFDGILSANYSRVIFL